MVLSVPVKYCNRYLRALLGYVDNGSLIRLWAYNIFELFSISLPRFESHVIIMAFDFFTLNIYLS